jgi:hypothetical protein
MMPHRRRYTINGDNDPPLARWDNCWEAERVQASPRFSYFGPISIHYANRRTWEACLIDCIKMLGIIYENGFIHVIRRVKLIETLNWESLFIPTWLSSCQSTNSPVGVNPLRRWSCYWTTATSSLRLFSRNVFVGTMTWSSRSIASRETPSPLPGTPNIDVILRHFHRCCYRSSSLWFFY